MIEYDLRSMASALNVLDRFQWARTSTDAADTITALRAEVEELRAALVQGFDLLSDAALKAMCAEIPSHDDIGSMTEWAVRAAALLGGEQ